MSEKQFTTKNIICSNYCVWDNNDKPYGNDELVVLLNELYDENEQLKAERRNDAKEFSALFKQNLRLKRENDKLKKEIKNDWVCGCCKHFHLGIKDRCDKGHNWILKDESCQDFERVGCGINEWRNI